MARWLTGSSIGNVATTWLVDGSIRVRLRTPATTQTEVSSAAIAPAELLPARATSIVATTWLVAGSILDTVPSRLFATQSAPAPTANDHGSLAGIVVMVGSMTGRVTAVVADTVAAGSAVAAGVATGTATLSSFGSSRRTSTSSAPTTMKARMAA